MALPALFLVISISLPQSAATQPPSPSAAAPRTSAQAPVPGQGSNNRNAAAREEPIEKAAKNVAVALASSDDPQLRTASCTLLEVTSAAPAAAPACDAATTDKSAAAQAEIATLAENARAGQPEAIERLRELASGLQKTDPSNAIDALAALPGQEGLDDLRALMKSSEPTVRGKAAAALSEKSPEEARKLVEQALKREAPSDLGFEAALGLAEAGQPEDVKRVSDWLPQLRGRNQFKAAGALAATGDVAGTKVLVDIAQKGDDDLLRLEAARALVKSRPDVAAEAVEAALANPNVWVRGEAASLASQLGPAWDARIRSLLDDESSWVRLQAARGVLRR
jgi:HEAT repeat protein